MKNVMALGNREVKSTNKMKNAIALGNADVKATRGNI